MKFFNFSGKKKNVSFYPIDLKGYGNATARFNTLQNDFALIDTFYSLPEVYIPITYISKKIASIKFDIVDKKTDKIISNSYIDNLIKYPNNLDSFEELIQKFFVFKFLTGNAYLNALTVAGMNKVSKLVVLPSQYTKIILTETNDFRLQEIKNFILEWNGQNTTIDPKNILYFKDINVKFQNNYYQYGISRLLSSKYNITSLQAAYSTRVSLYQHGARHILTGVGNEFNMLTPEQTMQEQNRINNDFGMTENQHQLMITRFPMTVTTLSKSVQELQLNEMNLADFQKVCSLYEVPTILLNDNDSSTFDNKKSAERDFYRNVVIPQAKEFYDNFLWWISELIGEKRQLEAKLIIENIESLSESRNDLVTRTIQELQSGIITQQEARKILNYENSI